MRVIDREIASINASVAKVKASIKARYWKTEIRTRNIERKRIVIRIEIGKGRWCCIESNEFSLVRVVRKREEIQTHCFSRKKSSGKSPFFILVSEIYKIRACPSIYVCLCVSLNSAYAISCTFFLSLSLSHFLYASYLPIFISPICSNQFFSISCWEGATRPWKGFMLRKREWTPFPCSWGRQPRTRKYIN